MIRNAKYVYDNVIIADETNTTKQFCKEAQVGVDLTVRKISILESEGMVLKNKTYASKYKELEKINFLDENHSNHKGWYLKRGTYNLTLNEGCSFGPNDTGKVIMRSSLNRCGVCVHSAVWDPQYTTKDGDVINSMNLRLTVESEGFYLEEDARVAQLVVFENEDTTAYNGQWQGGKTVSKLVKGE